MLTAFHPPNRWLSAPARRASREDDYRVKLFKAASRSAHDEIDRAAAALAERTAEERERARTRREALLREGTRR
jgi:hypothetical protein